MSKVRSDAVLKTQPEAVQAAVVEHLRANSLRDTVDWCAEELSLDVSVRMLGEFREWYESTGMLAEIKETADRFREDLARMPNIDLGDDTVGEISQMFFETMALKTRDPKLHVKLRSLRLREKEQQISLATLEQKIREYEDKMAAASDALKAMVDRGGLTPETINEIEEAMNLL